MMKKLILPILFLLISVTGFAQGHDEKFKELKIPFISERLNLTPDEAEKFWPIYNDYEEVSSKIRNDIHGIQYKIKKNINDLSNEKAKELLDKLSASERKRIDVDDKLNRDLLKFLPPKKVLILKGAEKEFKKRLFDSYLEKKMKSEKR
ncbi:sensor of ECF-type sigma factor [Aestuariibaculum sp. M13]|uniref:sensor of ECF-type sigma factor n=1 Tax=Aestuariibaculum sp. M13 TaxID=2967132 RepID=UPI002159FF65|nr:sensor of ECF-type sigma factor [Aestuariibaculum sp. M13]MCR8668563.1 sensor of ECF-type sigma factor [Aestuariibaculum sp. M13]